MCFCLVYHGHGTKCLIKCSFTHISEWRHQWFSKNFYMLRIHLFTFTSMSSGVIHFRALSQLKKQRLSVHFRIERICCFTVLSLFPGVIIFRLFPHHYVFPFRAIEEWTEEFCLCVLPDETKEWVWVHLWSVPTESDYAYLRITWDRIHLGLFMGMEVFATVYVLLGIEGIWVTAENVKRTKKNGNRSPLFHDWSTLWTVTTPQSLHNTRGDREFIPT